MDAFGFVYSQYWLTPEADSNFDKHLAVIKDHYGYNKNFEEVATKGAVDTESNLESKVVAPWLNINKLDEQSMMFKIMMKSNSEVAMTGDLSLNPLTRLWRRIEASGLLRQKLSEFMKVVELAVVTVLGSVEDERTFSTLSFMKNKLRNRLSIHLPHVVTMYGQDFYGSKTFLMMRPMKSGGRL
jgi:hypothetical protein